MDNGMQRELTEDNARTGTSALEDSSSVDLASRFPLQTPLNAAHEPPCKRLKGWRAFLPRFLEHLGIRRPTLYIQVDNYTTGIP